MAITYRSSKGSDLTPAEVDANFADLNTRTQMGWRDLICGLETRTGAQAPVLTNFRNGIYLYAFAPDTINEVFATAHIDHDYSLGTMLYPHIHWTTDSTEVGVVRWGYEYTWAQRNDDSGTTVFGPTTTIYKETTTNGVAYSHYVAEMANGNGIDGTGIHPDTVILLRVFRDGSHVNDTYTGNIYGFTVDLHYQCDRYATPNKDPDFYV